MTDPIKWPDTDPSDEKPSTPSTRRERQHAAHETGDPPRRTLPIGRVWIVGLVCLTIGSLLNAPGIRKTALGQPVGWKRDVSTFFANPLYDVSHALYFDRLRSGIQDIIGRGGQDHIDLSLPSPTTSTTVPGATTLPGATTTTTTAKPIHREAFSPSKMLRLWVGGDSLSITPGESVINQALATRVIGITDSVDGHVSTGLARPEVFNWPAYLQEVIAAKQPQAMVFTVGSNDDQDLTGDHGVGPFGTQPWQDEYRRRVGGLMDEVIASKVKLFWVGIPEIKDMERFNNHYRLINDIVKQEAARRQGKVVFVDTVPVLAGPDGNYSDFLMNPDGSLVQVRSGDGIHFTRAGGDRIANAVLAAMNTVYDFTSWTSATTTVPPTTLPATTTSRPPTKKKPAKKRAAKKKRKKTTTTSTTSTTVPAAP